MQQISPKRQLITKVLCLIIIGLVIYSAWYPARSNVKKSEGVVFNPKHNTVKLSANEQIEHRAYEIEAKLAYIVSKKSETFSKELGDEIILNLSDSLLTLNEKTGISLLSRKKFIIAHWLKADDIIYDICDRFSQASNSKLQELDEILQRSCPTEKTEKLQLTEAELDVLTRQLGWFGSLMGSLSVAENQEQLEKEVERQAEVTGKKFLTVGAVIGTLAIASIICLLILLAKLFSGRLQFYFTQSEIHPAWFLEVFTIYLGCMYVMPLIVKLVIKQGIEVNILTVNLFAISSLCLLIFWPCLFGVKRAELEHSVGLTNSNNNTLRNIAAGPFTYVASLSVLICVILVYSLALEALGIDPGGGSHPVVPILTNDASSTTVYTVFILAVIVAPFVEELMFRGAFYSWLRARFSPIAAIIISSLIFAAVHPQGALGVIPLTVIGMVLAFLREWRGDLLAPMVAHACFNAGTLLLALQVLG